MNQYVAKQGLVHYARFYSTLNYQTVMFPACYTRVYNTWSEAKTLADGCDVARGPVSCFECILRGMP